MHVRIAPDVVQRHCERSVKPPENSRTFTASLQNGLQTGGSRDLFSGGAHPYPQGLSDTGNLTFFQDLVAMLVGVLQSRNASAPAKVTIGVGSTHPDEILLQAAMGIDPRPDVGLIGAPQRLCGILSTREMKAEPRGGRDADLVARNVAKQDCACRLAGPDNADVDTTGCETSPARIVLRGAAAVIVIDLD